MKIFAASLRRLVAEQRLQSFAIIPNPSQHPETLDSTTSVLPEALAQYPGADLVGMKRTEDQWNETSRYRIISNHRDPDEDLCDCREEQREHEFIEAILNHCESAGASGFMYHQRGQMAIWWIESEERMRGYEIERLEDLVRLLVKKGGWGIEGLKYPDPSLGTATASGASSRCVEERFETISEWLKSIGVRGKGRGAGTKKGRVTR